MSSEISDEKAIITLEVELKADVTGLENSSNPPDSFFGGVPGADFEETIKNAVDESIKESLEEHLEDEGVDIDSLKNLTDLVKDIDSKGLKNMANAFKNPEGFGENAVIGALSRAGPYGLLAASIITTLIGAPEFVKAIVKSIGVKGGLINQDFRYSQEEFLSQQFDRQVQFRRATGDDPLITVNTFGFVKPSDPDFAGNSLVDANINRSARIGLRHSAYGYQLGI